MASPTFATQTVRCHGLSLFMAGWRDVEMVVEVWRRWEAGLIEEFRVREFGGKLRVVGSV